MVTQHEHRANIRRIIRKEVWIFRQLQEDYRRETWRAHIRRAAADSAGGMNDIQEKLVTSK